MIKKVIEFLKEIAPSAVICLIGILILILMLKVAIPYVTEAAQTEPYEEIVPDNYYETPPEEETLPENLIEETPENPTLQDYSLDYLMNYYGVIALGNADINQHCMGNLLVQGDLSGNYNNFADSPYTVAPSYIGGYVSKPGGPNGRSKYSGVPLYVGSSNTVDGTTLNGIVNYNHGDPIFISDEYISWAWVYASAVDTIDYVQELSAGAEPIRIQWSWQQVEIQRGTITNVILGGNYCKIRLTGEYTGETTVINVLDSGTVPNPQVVGLSQGEENAGSEPICITYPYAEGVVVPTELTPEIGCIIAPYANIEVKGGNTNGCLLGWNVSTYGQGHMWPYRAIQEPEEPETEETETQSIETEQTETEQIETEETELITEIQSETETEKWIETETEEYIETEVETEETETQEESETEIEEESQIQTEIKEESESESESEIESEIYFKKGQEYKIANWGKDNDEDDDDSGVRGNNRKRQDVKGTTSRISQSILKPTATTTPLKPPKTGDQVPISRLVYSVLVSFGVLLVLSYAIRNRRD